MRLPNTVTPKHYDLYFEPNLKTFKYDASTNISLEIKKPTRQIVLNARDLKIKKVKLSQGKNIQTPKNIKLDKKSETLTLVFNKSLKPGKADLFIDFQGIHNDELSGFYRSMYKDKNGKEKYLVTSQMEAPYARQAFPCFDEPALKATFSVSMKIPKALKAISNMPIQNSKTLKDSTLVVFQKTPVMSTYLLYLGVGDFEFLTGKLGKTKIRIVTLPGKSKQGKLALKFTKQFLQYFEKYSGIRYPLPKLDMLAIPDFSAGAMENWGAITYREILLLYDPKETSTAIKKRIAEVIAHELWHQWSGNLVTMEWWDDLWLNESFATYMAYKAMDHYYPDWKMWEDFVNNETSGALEADSLKSTHPIAVRVNSANEIEEIFDAISYGKGGSVLRMIDSYIGEKNFQRGVSQYLKKYKYKNAEANDLWNELSKHSKEPIKPVLESWISQPGHPILKIKDNSKIVLSQKPFSYLPNKNKRLWKIPLTVLTEKGEIRKLITKDTTLENNNDWYKININQQGFYRTHYSKNSLEKLKPLILSKKLSTFDRWGIQHDLFNLTISDDVKIKDYLEFLETYKNEDSYFVLSDIFINLHYINRRFPKSRVNTLLKETFQNNLKRLSWNVKKGESQDESLLRALCINYLSFAKDKDIIEKGKHMFNSQNTIHPDLKGTIYALVARSGGEKEYRVLEQMYIKSNSPEDKMKLLSSLYRFNSPKLLKKALDFSLTSHVRTQNLRGVFAGSEANPQAEKVIFPWMKKHWSTLAKYEKTHFVFMGLLNALITPHVGKQMKTELKKFLNSKKVQFKKTQANAFERLDINTRWIQNNKKL